MRSATMRNEDSACFGSRRYNPGGVCSPAPVGCMVSIGEAGISWEAHDMGRDGSLFGRGCDVFTLVYRRCGAQRMLQGVCLAGGGGLFSNWLDDLAHLPASGSKKLCRAICWHSEIFARKCGPIEKKRTKPGKASSFD